MLFKYFVGSNEGIISGVAEMKDFMVKCEERPLEGGGVCEIPVRLPMNDCGMETVEHIWVDI